MVRGKIGIRNIASINGQITKGLSFDCECGNGCVGSVSQRRDGNYDVPCQNCGSTKIVSVTGRYYMSSESASQTT